MGSAERKLRNIHGRLRELHEAEILEALECNPTPISRRQHRELLQYSLKKYRHIWDSLARK